MVYKRPLKMTQGGATVGMDIEWILELPAIAFSRNISPAWLFV